MMLEHADGRRDLVSLMEESEKRLRQEASQLAKEKREAEAEKRPDVRKHKLRLVQVEGKLLEQRQQGFKRALGIAKERKGAK